MTTTPSGVRVTEVPTTHGPARCHECGPTAGAPTVGLLVLGHGAGGSVDAPDLVAARDAAVATGWRVVLVEQPYRVAGRRAPPGAARLDLAWIETLAAIRGGTGLPRPLVVGGRSSGARVACRTAAATGAEAVLCLAFPWHPPGRPERSRATEMTALDLPILAIQGDRDPFGPPPGDLVTTQRRIEVAIVAGDGHALRRHPESVGAAVTAWLAWLAG